ncbi:hypothetical protein, partial [Corallococcus carmarthensis]|uniref:hypothetical protein n=1 Tax=Corallococcus carmarthensis TaxID=2316728 RepID=UPI0018322F86
MTRLPLASAPAPSRPGGPPGFARVLALLVPVASAFAVLVGALLLRGWALSLATPGPEDGGLLAAGDAWGLVSAGSGLWLLHSGAARGWRRALGWGLAAVTFLLGAGGLVRHA